MDMVYDKVQSTRDPKCTTTSTTWKIVFPSIKLIGVVRQWLTIVDKNWPEKMAKSCASILINFCLANTLNEIYYKDI